MSESVFKPMRGMIVASGLIGLCGCAADESVRQDAIANCLQVGIAENDPQFPICTRSYALQQQDAALNRNYGIQEDMKERDRRSLRKQDVFR